MPLVICKHCTSAMDLIPDEVNRTVIGLVLRNYDVLEKEIITTLKRMRDPEANEICRLHELTEEARLRERRSYKTRLFKLYIDIKKMKDKTAYYIKHPQQLTVKLYSVKDTIIALHEELHREICHLTREEVELDAQLNEAYLKILHY